MQTRSGGTIAPHAVVAIDVHEADAIRDRYPGASATATKGAWNSRERGEHLLADGRGHADAGADVDPNADVDADVNTDFDANSDRNAHSDRHSHSWRYADRSHAWRLRCHGEHQ
jgi:hypothetical protein